MAITAKLVQQLREQSGAGMMDCKRALQETNGDIDAAIEFLRKQGSIKAGKKADRIAAEGIVVVLKDANSKVAVLLEVNCETDFVARDENFLEFANKVASLVLEKRVKDLKDISSLTYDSNANLTVDGAREALIMKIGENITLRRYKLFVTEGHLGTYSHSGRIGVVVEISGSDDELAKDLAMHVAASKPIVVSPKDVPADEIAKERDVYMAQAEGSGKPKDIIEKMVTGRINKFVDEVSLMGQPFVKDPNTKVEKLLSAKNLTVIAFERFEVGEGIEKVISNFREEVMSQIGQTN